LVQLRASRGLRRCRPSALDLPDGLLGSSYGAQVLTGEGARVLRIELPNAGGRGEGTEYEREFGEVH